MLPEHTRQTQRRRNPQTAQWSVELHFEEAPPDKGASQNACAYDCGLLKSLGTAVLGPLIIEQRYSIKALTISHATVALILPSATSGVLGSLCSAGLRFRRPAAMWPGMETALMAEER